MPPTPPSPNPHPETSAPAPPPATGRTRHGLALGLAAASVVLGGTAHASAAPQRGTADRNATVPRASLTDQQPECGDENAPDFPIDTRIHGGPDTYASGGGYGTWFLDLTNTTTRPCHAIHPVLVLTDEERTLTADQIQLEFSERTRPGVEHRVHWETTDRDEHIGVFGGDGDSFPGFTVPPGRTVTVQVRLAFTSDTSPGRITANAAIVQRRSGGDPAGGGGDGEWVGESEDYPFTVVDDDGAPSRDDADDPGTDVPGTGRDGTAGRHPVAPGLDPAGVPELARTGIQVPVPLPALTVAGFLIGGGAVVLGARRARRTGH
ncbi:hypothetical protein [Streptomyces sp. NPDC057682]|uniref:hypothetical protein n=1 Tax=Streptomyces sp. NPDC057682 TaxID=3346210 RepID=UPI0036BF2408